MKAADIKKVILWRILSVLVSIAVAYLYLGEIRSAGELTVILSIVMTVLHYFFEGWWRKFNDS